MQDKRTMAREIETGLYNLSQRVGVANIGASMEAGHMPHEVFYGFVLPAGSAHSYFAELNKALEDPTLSRTGGRYYVGRVLGKPRWITLPFNPFYLRELRKESDVAKRSLEGMPQDELETIHRGVTNMLQQDLEGSVAHWVDAQEHRAGQHFTEEDKTKMQPVIEAMKVIQAVYELQQKYKLSF